MTPEAALRPPTRQLAFSRSSLTLMAVSTLPSVIKRSCLAPAAVTRPWEQRGLRFYPVRCRNVSPIQVDRLEKRRADTPWLAHIRLAHYPWVRVPAGLVIFLQTGHSQARTGSRLNHVNIVAIDSSVGSDIVPKI